MKKILKYGGATLIALLAVAYLGLWAWAQSRHASATTDALAALASDSSAEVKEGQYLTFSPANGRVRLGVIFYPGANCDIRGYAPVLRRLAAAGYFVVDVPMPLEFAFLAPDRALDVMAAYPEVKRWAIIGHSLGGAMAGSFTNRHPDRVAGLVVWDSYPPENRSLADFPKPVWHIHRATADGAPPPAFEAHRASYPASSRWVPIRGGIHMYFGAFDGGGYVEDWVPTISREEQHEQVVAATLEALRDIEDSRPSK
jgi:pimeloyl-ACP methyl ester carboxylesterase